jgi:hypothetical protein
VNRHTPLLVMIRDEMRLTTNPSATGLTIGGWRKELSHQESIGSKMQPPSTSVQQG